MFCREISGQLQHDKESLRIKLNAKDKQANRLQIKFNEIKVCEGKGGKVRERGRGREGEERGRKEGEREGDTTE